MTENILIEFMFIIMLSVALIWNLNEDRVGKDINHKRDVFWRGAIMISTSLLVWGISHALEMHHGFFDSLYMSFSIFFLMFDYAEAAKLGHEDWFSYLDEPGTGNESKIDQIKFWRNMHPWWRFVIRFVNFAIALIIYF